MASAPYCGSLSGYNDPLCVSFMANYCSTDIPFGDTYKEKWEGDPFTSYCRAYTELNIGQQTRYVPTTDAYVRRYLITDGNPITFAQQGSLIYDPAIEDVIDVCQTYPNACDAVLNQVCQGFTREDLRGNPNAGKLCGCFMADEEYDTYQGAFGVSKVCDPACTLQSAVKPRDVTDPLKTLTCGQTICVIDDVKIELLNNTVVGDINFAQACSSCGVGAACQCFISDISVSATESTVAGVNFEQQCGGGLFCYESDEQGVPRQVDCTSLENGEPTAPPAALTTSTILIIIAVIAAIIIIVIVIAVVAGRRRDVEPSIYAPSRYGGFSST